jgi:hypothetical protein
MRPLSGADETRTDVVQESRREAAAEAGRTGP